jgi:serine protease Do
LKGENEMYDNENMNGNPDNSGNDNMNSYYNSSDSSNTDSYYNSSENNNTDSSGSGSDNGNAGSYYNSSDSNNAGGYYNSSDSNNTGGYYNNTGSADNGNGPEKKNKNSKTPVIVVAIIVAVIIIGALVATVVTTYKDIISSDSGQLSVGSSKQTETSSYQDIGSTSVESSSSDSSSSTGVTVTDVSDVVDATIPSVVAITSTTLVENSYSYYDDIFERYFGSSNGNSNSQGGQTYEEQAAGSGIIVDQTDTELLILTNNHVVEDADSLAIQFYGQDEDTVTGYIKGTDSDADVAVVAVKLSDIPEDILGNIKKATLGDSDSVKVGEGVIAIGNALGYGQSVTTGVISAKDREATIDNKKMTLLQTDAAINGGNSGGALINSKGEVIGINVAKYSSSGTTTSASIEGMGFAIPISSVKDIISNLETKETRTKVDEDEQGYLGITGYDVSSSDSQQYSIPVGVYVYNLAKNGPAAKAGIEESDVITKFDGQSVTSMETLQSIMSYYKSGEKIKVTIAYRDGKEYKEKEVTVTLGDKSVTDQLQTNN